MDTSRIVDFIVEAIAEGQRTFMRRLEEADLVRAREDLQGWKSATKRLLMAEVGREAANQFETAGDLDILYPTADSITAELGKHLSFLNSVAEAISSNEITIDDGNIDPAVVAARRFTEVADLLTDVVADAKRFYMRRLAEGDLMGARNDLQLWKAQTRRFIYDRLGQNLAAMFSESGDLDITSPSVDRLGSAVGQHLTFLRQLIDVVREKGRGPRG